MNQGDAAVWAAVVAGATGLLGALGGVALQGRISRRQVQDQEEVAVRHWLREHRQVAYTTVLERAEAVYDATDPIISAQVQPDWDWNANHRELWMPANETLRALERSVITVAVTGPEGMEPLAREVHDAALALANSLRMPGTPFHVSAAHFAHARERLEEARRRFVDASRALLSGADG